MSHSFDNTTDLTDLIDSRLNDYAFVQAFKSRRTNYVRLSPPSLPTISLPESFPKFPVAGINVHGGPRWVSGLASLGMVACNLN